MAGSHMCWTYLRWTPACAVALISLALAPASLSSAAETPEEFYKSHPLSIVIGFPPASAYDLYGRAVGRHNRIYP